MVRTSPPAPVAMLGTVDPVRLERLRRLSHLLDDAIPIPGTRYRVGWEAVVGLVPGVGDLVGGGFSLYIILQAARMGATASLLMRMGWNLLVDIVVGAVPLLGDLFDAGYKANMRNLALLDGHARSPVQSGRASRRFVAVLLVLLGLMLVGAFALAVFLIQLAFSRPVL